jgi:hypothetical protein
MLLFTFLTLAIALAAIPASALKVTETAGTPQIEIVQDDPFYITDASVKDGVLTFTITISEKNASVKDASAVKVQVLDVASKSLSVSSLKIGDSEKLAKSADLKGDSYTVYIAKEDAKDGYSKKVKLNYSGGEKFTVHFGISSAAIVITSATDIEVDNGEYYAKLSAATGTFMTVKSYDRVNYAANWAFNAGWFRTSDDTTADIFSGSTNPAISVKLDLSPVAAVLHTQSTSGGTTESWRDDYFKVGSNWTDSVQLTKSTNNANQGSVYIRPNASELYCAGQSWVGVNTAFNYDLSSYRTLWCAMRNNTATGAFVTWRNTNPIQGTGTGQIGRVGSGGGLYNLLGFMYDGATSRANPSRIDFREGVTNGTDDSLLAETQRIADLKNGTVTITNLTYGGAVPGWGGVNGTLGLDMVTCVPDNKACSASLTDLANVTRMYVMGNFSPNTTELFINAKRNSATVSGADICLNAYNDSGVWKYHSVASTCGLDVPEGQPVRTNDIYANETWVSTYNDGSNLVFAAFFTMLPSDSGLAFYVGNINLGGDLPSTKVYARDETTGAYLTFNLTLANSTNSYSWTNQNPLSIFSDNTILPSGWVTATATSNVGAGYGQATKYFWLNRSGDNNQTVWLLSNSVGAYIRFHTLTITELAIPGALVEISKGGILLNSQLTDGSGTATFFMNPLSTYLVSSSKAGYATNTSVSIQPTSTDYKIYLVSSSAGYNSTSFSNVIWTFVPVGALVNKSQVFNFTIVNSNITFTEYGFLLVVNGTTLYSGHGTASGGGSLTPTIDLGPYAGTIATVTLNFTQPGFGTNTWSFDLPILENPAGNNTLFYTLTQAKLGICQGTNVITTIGGVVWCLPLAIISLFVILIVGAAGAGLYGLNGGGLAGVAVLWLFAFLSWFPGGIALIITLGVVGLILYKGGF